MADVRNSKLEIRNSAKTPWRPIGAEFRFSSFDFLVPQSAIGPLRREDLVFGVANCHSAIMSLFELGTSYPKTGHLSREFRPPFSLTP
ncbi:MAG: hypothetical protein WCD04_00380 [Terriglobia bacterium]